MRARTGAFRDPSRSNTYTRTYGTQTDGGSPPNRGRRTNTCGSKEPGARDTSEVILDLNFPHELFFHVLRSLSELTMCTARARGDRAGDGGRLSPICANRAQIRTEMTQRTTENDARSY